MTVTILKLKDSIIKQIRESLELKNKLQYELGISSSTLFRMLKSNSQDLTQATTLKILKDELGLTDDELLTEVTEDTYAKD